MRYSIDAAHVAASVGLQATRRSRYATLPPVSDETSGASNELGAFERGLLAQFIGTVGSIVLGGALSIAAAGLWALFFPGLRKINRFEEITPAVDPDAVRS